MKLSSLFFIAAIALSAGAYAATNNSDAGKTLYTQNCAMCHGSNGEGAVPGAPNFTKPNGVLSLPDKVLTKRVLNGYHGSGAPMAMPSMKTQVTKAQVHEILEYMHEAFGVPASGHND